MRLSLEITVKAEAFAILCAEQHLNDQVPVGKVPPGSENRADARGLYGNVGDLGVSVMEMAAERYRGI